MTLSPVTSGYTRWDQSDRRLVSSDETEWFAGGTDLIPLARSGVLDLDSVVDIKSSHLERTVQRIDDRWRIGALATLSDLAEHEELTATVPAIAQAVSQSATLQIRHRATVAGNLLQRPRCSYFRDPSISCWMKGGSDCPARDGRNEHHALIDEPCVATQPSDLASVLVALDADVNIDGHDGSERTVPVAELLQRPVADRRSLHTLESGDVITSLEFTDPGTSRSTYLKAMNRAVWQFALVGVAAIVDIDDRHTVVSASLVASGVDSVPRRLTTSSETLTGRELTASSIASAADAAADGLTELSENGYKTALLRGLVQRSLEPMRGG
ncbi:FAD binding domain-containing protein [Ilumatobacter nonamiensis]|uniref:FAD binding domain-containing protein n=1 Tax=Ilumatobacter nonamiensis TaxID=467093 RepID=UPI0003480E47|nr:FAD binding domain-containing protein [Ilumatobacter nonamiensis]